MEAEKAAHRRRAPKTPQGALSPCPGGPFPPPAPEPRGPLRPRAAPFRLALPPRATRQPGAREPGDRGEPSGAMSEGAASAEALVKFEDVIIYFSRDEWVMLEEWQKDLYWKVLKDTYESLIVVGRPVTKTDVLAWIEWHECLNSNGARQSKASNSSGNLCPYPSNQRHAQACHKECIKQAGSLQVIYGRSEVDTALHNDIRGSHSQSAVILPKPYECGECGKTFRLKSLLQIHQKVSVKKGSFPCPKCKMCFPSSSRLRLHQRIHFQGFRKGGKGRLQENRLNAHHENSQALEKPHCCTDCGQSFRRYLDYLKHRKSHEVAKAWLCAQCGNVFMSQSDLVMHEESHLEEATHERVRCGQNCICEPSLQLHFAPQISGTTVGLEDQLPQEFYAKEKKPYLCVHCGLQFKLEVNLGVHYRYCVKGRLLKWGVNGTPQDLKVHSQHLSQTSAQQTGPDRSKFIPHRPGQKRQGGRQRDSAEHDKSIASVESSGGSLKSCATKKLYKCQDCGKTFVYKWQLCVHLKSHGVGKRYLCSFCGKSFVCKSGLRNHCRTHQGGAGCKEDSRQENLVPAVSHRMDKEKLLYPCNECGNSFTKSYMPYHRAFHAGVRYRCLFCGRVFNFKSGATAHRKLHRVRGDFSTCPKCNGKGELPSADCLCRIERFCIAPGLQTQGGKGVNLHKKSGKRIFSTRHLNSRQHVHLREKHRSGAEDQTN